MNHQLYLLTTSGRASPCPEEAFTQHKPCRSLVTVVFNELVEGCYCCFKHCCCFERIAGRCVFSFNSLEIGLEVAEKFGEFQWEHEATAFASPPCSICVIYYSYGNWCRTVCVSTSECYVRSE